MAIFEKQPIQPNLGRPVPGRNRSRRHKNYILHNIISLRLQLLALQLFSPF